MGNQYEQLYLENRETGRRYRVGPMIAPGGESRVEVARPAGGELVYSLMTETGAIRDGAEIAVG